MNETIEVRDFHTNLPELKAAEPTVFDRWWAANKHLFTTLSVLSEDRRTTVFTSRRLEMV